jgi:arginine-tRNA-protein transferase
VEQPRWTSRRPPELVVYDALHSCPYLEGREARLPMRLPSHALTPEELDARLAEGDRRHGPFFYRPSCPSCVACEAIRIPVRDFVFSASQRRALAKGRRAVRIEMGDPVADQTRLVLYEKHKQGRDLVSGAGEPLDLEGYQSFLVDRAVQSLELRMFRDDALVALAVTDRGATALSLVYCFWDPAHARLGLGTYSILEHIALAQRWGVEHVYLGLYIGANAHMSYKARFTPHERLIDAEWRRFE